MLVLLGHASYYPRFGFEPARASGVEPPDPNWGDAHWMIRRLSAWDASMGGQVVYPPAFEGL